MRPDGHLDGRALQAGDPFHGNAQLRRRTAPEQIRRRGGDHQKVRMKSIDAPPGFRQVEIVGLGIDQQRLMAGGEKLAGGEHQFQRNVRLLAAEISGALEVPVRIDQGKLHPALPESSVARANGASAGARERRRLASTAWFSSQNSRSRRMVFSRLTSGFHPVWRWSLLVSVT